MVEPIAWVRPDATFTEVLCLGPVRPANATGNPDEWVPVFPPSYITSLEAEVSRLTALVEEVERTNAGWDHTSQMLGASNARAYEAEKALAEALEAQLAERPARHIGTIAHVDHGKTSIAAAVARHLSALEATPPADAVFKKTDAGTPPSPKVNVKALEDAWTRFCDANPDDLTSPDDLPDHALMTCAQFVGYALSALEATPPAPKVTEKKDVDAIRSRASRVLERMKQTPHGPKRKLLATQHVELTNEALRAEGWNAALTAALSGDAS